MASAETFEISGRSISCEGGTVKGITPNPVYKESMDCATRVQYGFVVCDITSGESPAVMVVQAYE